MYLLLCMRIVAATVFCLWWAVWCEAPEATVLIFSIVNGRSIGRLSVCLSVYLIVIVGVVYVQRATTRNPPQSVARSSKRKLSSGATSSCCNSSARAWRFYVYVRVSFVYFCAREKLRSSLKRISFVCRPPRRRRRFLVWFLCFNSSSWNAKKPSRRHTFLPFLYEKRSKRG